MAVMMGNLYSALVKAGAGEDDAKKAAEEVANFELRLNNLEAKIDRLEAKMEGRFGAVDARLNVLFWMVGLNMAMTLAMVGILLRRSL
ncbi:MAG: hypothetical protein ACRC7G_16400, partial [Beijerinckiaceae bacterium]